MSLGEGKWKGASGGIQIYLLLTLWFFGIILGASFSELLLGDAAYSSASNIRIANSIGSIFLFLIPATVYAFLFADARGEYLVSKPIVLKTLLLSALVIFAVQPLVEFINDYNELITLPQSMSELNEFFRVSKESTTKTLGILFAEDNIPSLLPNLLVMAILPGITEELFFRGCMQRSMTKIANNVHVAIWITALIFSLMHFQLEGLFPRIALGALLGYLYAWTKNIWVPIVVHTINNASIVIIQQCFKSGDMNLADYSLSSNPIIVVVSLLITAILLFFIHRWRFAEAEATDANQ